MNLIANGDKMSPTEVERMKPKTHDLSDLITVAVCAEIAKVLPASVHRAIKEKRLKSHRIGHQHMINLEDAYEYAKQVDAYKNRGNSKKPTI